IGGSAGAAFGTLSTLDNIHAHYTPADPRVNARGWKDYSYEGRMRIGDLGGGIGVTFLSQYPDVDQYYRLGRDPQHPSFRLAAHPQGVQTIKSAAAGQDRTDSGIEPLPDTWYRFLIKVEDTGARTNIKAKVWPEGDSEPDFQIDAYDDYNFSAAPGERPVRLTSGTVGVWASGAGAKSFDTMRVLNGVLLAENFDAYATNQNPAGWRDTQKDSSYEEDDGLFRIFDVDHNSAFGTDRRNESIHSHYTAPDVLSWTNYLYRGRLRSSLIQGERADKIGIGLTFFSRYPEGPDPRDEHRYDRYYRLRRTPDDRNFVLAPHPDKRQFDGVTALTPALVDFAPDIWYRFLIKVEDTGAATRIRAKVWRDDGLEPSQFQLDAADKQNTADRDRPIRLTSGTVGLWAGYKGACYFDDLQVAHVALLSEDYAAADWTETAARSPRVVDDSLFEAIDAQDHTIRWVTVGDFPLLLRPLSRAALGFDGRRTYLAGPAHGAPDLSQLTIEAWINLAGSQEHPILSMGGSDPASPPAWFGAVVAADGSQSLAFHTGSAQDLARPVDPANPIQIGRPGAFTYVAASLSGDKVTYFVDGAPLGDLPLAPALALKLGRLEIGRDMGARYFGGQIKEVRLWKTARTAAQITATAERYQRPAPADDLIGYWAFDEADGETARDSSGQQNDLRLGG
ncbi:MAG TPA: LamG domain-containing protein, partial [Roseiflexaceae bacterium]